MWPFAGQRRISEDDLADLHGKVVIITGGYSGIGYYTTQFLARKGAKVYLATRNEEGTKDAIARLEKDDTGDGSLHWLKIELADPHSAKSAAEEFLKKEDRLDILINNAGKAVGPYGLTEDGLRDSMAINYLGHFIFTETLLPLLIQTSKQEGSDVRIINLSSRGHTLVSPTSFSGKEIFNKTWGPSWRDDLATYGLSKLANILHTKHLQRRLNKQKADIICISIHPGAVMTPNVQKFLNNRSPLSRPFFRLLLSLIFGPMREGAMNSAYTAASPEVKATAEAFKGAYVDPVGKFANPSAAAREERMENELYDTTLEILKELEVGWTIIT
ncbi:hypothetical protein NP233_g2381 [Leucocoprinus birnbaumii]|uniref:NAD(P)-binding protein n=1 Tax=Leucocoprinus birnbaumii TaxID=56174 RepID=A0AAD5W1H1_9AGAR|nr:hypothetical protein NP233_g2381 [Leucocoprinus birnbaumii]